MSTNPNQQMNILKFGSPLDFNKVVNDFLQECRVRNFTKGSIRRYRNGLKKFYHCLEARQLPIHELKAYDLTHKIIPDMLQEGLAIRTINCNICILKEFFKYLTVEGLLKSNIASDLKPFQVKPAIAHTFTEGHLQLLFAQPNRSTFTGYRNYVMMLVLLDSGIRLKELTNLKVTDIDFQEPSLRIEQGKGRKARQVPIQQTCSFHLKQYVEERGPLSHDHLWVTLENQPFQAPGIRVMISRYCKAASIEEVQCSCHTFRHTMAKLYLLGGGDIFTLKNILGHERLETTEYYIELFSRDLQAQHEKYSPVESFMADLLSSDESEVDGK